ncbi:oxysterol-binding protein-related protein 2A-like [Phragmites australis]|uniref:oxysterol-binding protein-related protein 2A-like n=1 Tax=Phragmites australis TaxID=29695 RepID=UPI002D798605|nr:oxysterol-binding protein-related protein 2A-like [Phragmites australis]
MRPRDLHPLCCLPVGDRCSPPPPQPEEPPAVAGVLYKWTNIGKGWRPRWFLIRNDVLAYSKIRRRSRPAEPAAARLIGPAECGDDRPIGFVHLKNSSFRESKSDDRRFYIITPTKTLQLRTDSANDRVAWIEALVSTRAESSPNGGLLDQNDASFSAVRLRNRMHADGLGEEIIKDCEQIVHSEFSQYYAQMKQRCEEYLSFLGSLSRQHKALNADDTANVSEPHPHLIKPEYSCSGHGKCSESSNTESSDDVGRQESDELSDEDDYHFYDTRQSFSDSAASPDLKMKISNSSKDDCLYGDKFVEPRSDMGNSGCLLLSSKHRTKLPKPVETEKGVSLWSMIKDNVGKDLTRVCLPVYFNEPLSSLQKCFEDLEYSYLLDRAYEYGLKGNSLMRILYVAAFAVSGYASSDGRPCKPFNPLLGETYEAEYPENGIRFFSEKVSHHPMVMACHCEGKGWKFWGDSNVKSKFWGQTIQLDPVGVLTLEFDDGETFQWSKVTTTINNLIIGRVYCHHHGTMNISGNREYSCKLTFKQLSFLERNPRQVHGFVKDVNGAKVATLMGKWDESLYCITTDDASRVNFSALGPNADATLLWEKNEPSTNPTRYNLSSFAITLNELTPELKEKLPPTDSRLRPDQRHLENGEYDKANAEKLRLETRQRMSRKMQEFGWKPRWFQRDTEDGTFRYTGGYWEAREQGKWDDCHDIFGEFSDNRKLQASQPV